MRRYGRVRVQKPRDEKGMACLAEVMSYLNVVVVRAELMWESDHVEYVLWSPSLRDIHPGEVTPEYLLTVRMDETGCLEKACFEEVKP